METLSVTAHLYSGFVASDPWSPAIDGILAYWHLRERLGPDAFAISQGHDHAMAPVDDLPLEIVRHGAWWWYACSSPLMAAQANVRRHLHRRFDQTPAEQYLPEGMRKVQTQAGAYKNARMAVVQHVTDRVSWHVIGERDPIERLLAQCHHIGARVGVGFGRVRRWEIVPGDERMARHHRPLPVDYAAAAGIDGERMLWGIRPPGRLAVNQAESVMPFTDQRLTGNT